MVRVCAREREPAMDGDLSDLVVVVAAERAERAEVDRQRRLERAAGLGAAVESRRLVPELERGVEAWRAPRPWHLVRQDPHVARVVGHVHERVRGADTGGRA